MVVFKDLYKRELTHTPYGRSGQELRHGSTFYRSFHFAKRFPQESDLEVLEQEFKIRVITGFAVFSKALDALRDMGGFPEQHKYIFAINGIQFKIRNMRWTPRIFEYIDFISETQEFSVKFALVDTAQQTLHPNKEVIALHTDFRGMNTPTIYASLNFFLLSELMRDMERKRFYSRITKIMNTQKVIRKVR